MESIQHYNKAMYFTLWGLTRGSEGYVMSPLITIYENMVEYRTWMNKNIGEISSQGK
jgi:hypothetical protein